MVITCNAPPITGISISNLLTPAPLSHRLKHMKRSHLAGRVNLDFACVCTSVDVGVHAPCWSNTIFFKLVRCLKIQILPCAEKVREMWFPPKSNWEKETGRKRPGMLKWGDRKMNMRSERLRGVHLTKIQKDFECSHLCSCLPMVMGTVFWVWEWRLLEMKYSPFFLNITS